MGCGASTGAPPQKDAAPVKAASAPVASGGKNQTPDWEEEPPKPLTSTETALVAKLYDLCDSADGSKGDGIDLAKLSKIEVSAGGPATMTVFETLTAADVSKDGIVTLAELTAFFTKSARFLSEAEFKDVMSGLTDALAPEWLKQPVKPLSATEMELVNKLYALCDPLDGVTGDGIDLKKLGTMEVSAGGPNTVKLCKELENADLSQDGIVTIAELTDYFTNAARFLSESEFSEVVGSLIDSAASIKGS